MSISIFSPRFRTPRRCRGSRVSLTEGRGQIVDAKGRIVWAEDWQSNALADEGEQNVLNTWLREQAHLGKYLALLTATPGETTTMASMSELFAPPSNGYARQQISAGDWSTPVLDAGDYQSEAAEKTFGPATATWSNFTHIALVTAAIGTGGKFLLFVALSGTISLAVDQSFKYTLRTKAI